MPKLPKRLPYEFALLAALALSSCDDSNVMARFTNGDRDRIDVADVNARNALDRISSLDSRLTEVESKLNM